MKNIRFRVVSLLLALFSVFLLKINNLDSFELNKFKSAAKDLRSINLNSYASKDVQINENLADAITFYWDNYQSYKEIRNGILKEVNYKNRYFTYANQLVSATKKMLDRKHLESIESGEREI